MAKVEEARRRRSTKVMSFRWLAGRAWSVSRCKDLGPVGDRVLDGPCDLGAWLVDVAKAVCLIDDDEVPGDGPDGIRSSSRELVRAHDNHVGLVEGVCTASPLGDSERPRVEHDERDEEVLL
jgi:hypothetical protein